MINQLKSYFQSLEDISFVFLFGSCASGRTFKESDVDIAIYFKDEYSFERVKNIWSDLEDLLKKDIDLITLNTAPPLIGYSAIRGKAIVVNDYAIYLDYMLRISQEAEDFSEFLLDMWKLKEKLKSKRISYESYK
jgi:hypothetical protein